MLYITINYLIRTDNRSHTTKPTYSYFLRCAVAWNSLRAPALVHAARR